jgi:hypothetical protein
MSTALRSGVARLELTAQITLAVLALASGVYTYLGVRDLLNGNATVIFFAAVIYSVAVSVGIYAFWTFLLRFMPHVRDFTSRALLFGCMLLGSLMIIAMSAWLNASALAGSAAIQQHLAISLQSYTRDLDKAHSNALAAQSLLPDIQLASTRFAKLAEAERAGSLTGTSGSGTVVQLLTQMSIQLSGLATEVAASGERVKALFEQGGKHLAAMREVISSRGPINERSDAFATEAMALMGTIGSRRGSSHLPPADVPLISPTASRRSSARWRRQSLRSLRRFPLPPTKSWRSARSSRRASSLFPRRKRCFAMRLTSSRAGPVRSRSI